jgi:hypothetical protein
MELTYGNSYFTDAPRYKYGLLIAAGCAIAAVVVVLLWKLAYRLFDSDRNEEEEDFVEENSKC